MLNISAQSTVYVRSVISAIAPNGNSINPTGDTVVFAFLGPYTSQGLAQGAVPTTTTTWYSGSWDSGTPYTARCLVGPNGGITSLASGAYTVWVKITDSPEVPVLLCGVMGVS